DPLEPGFNPNAMTLFDAWAPNNPNQKNKRVSVYRGQQIFNTKPIAITGVAGLNDLLGVTTLMGTCTTCHNTPNVGNHSTTLPINIGIGAASRRTPDTPPHTRPNKTSGRLVPT